MQSPVVMGILNLTPDSFYDGGKYDSMPKVIGQAARLYEEGAFVLDLGAYSSRPGAEEVSQEQEWDRLKGVIKGIKNQFPDKLIAVDTFRSEIAYRSLQEGADIINDISGGFLDHQIWKVAADHKAPYIAMHMKGTPATMQQLTQYSNLPLEVLDYFVDLTRQAKREGLTDLILDPGFGFAKTTEQNYELLNQLDVLRPLQTPVLVGLSRKSMIYKSLGTDPSEALNGTTALHMAALLKGVDILRVHDVKEALESITLYHKIRG
ncbi:MAG: dihydropteroate synthase [Chitinophagaceae bacterium]|nr:dihydropteroate synthase [Chitinophagaceae bacterium]